MSVATAQGPVPEEVPCPADPAPTINGCTPQPLPDCDPAQTRCFVPTAVCVGVRYVNATCDTMGVEDRLPEDLLDMHNLVRNPMTACSYAPEANAACTFYEQGIAPVAGYGIFVDPFRDQDEEDFVDCLTGVCAEPMGHKGAWAELACNNGGHARTCLIQAPSDIDVEAMTIWYCNQPDGEVCGNNAVRTDGTVDLNAPHENWCAHFTDGVWDNSCAVNYQSTTQLHGAFGHAGDAGYFGVSIGGHAT